MPKKISSEEAKNLAREYLSEQIQIIILDENNIDYPIYNFDPKNEYILAYSFQNELRTGPTDIVRISKNRGKFLGCGKIGE